MSVSKESSQGKCTEISDEIKKESICTMLKKEESLMRKVRLRIGEQMDLNVDFFNEKLESLKRRVEQLECTKPHEEIAKTLLKKASRLERLINPVIASQERVLSMAAAPQSEMKERKLKGIHLKEESHSYNFQAISSSSKDPHLAKDPFCPELVEEFEDPPQNPETRRGFCVKSEGDCTALNPWRK